MTKFKSWYVGPNSDGTYRLPRKTYDLLCVRLRGFRNHEAAVTLAVFLCRIWAAPNVFGQAFPIDRRALRRFHPEAKRYERFPAEQTLDLSEDRIRGAIKTLEKIGFLDRVERSIVPVRKCGTLTTTQNHQIETIQFGSSKVVSIRRRPIHYHFGSDFEAPLRHNATVPKKSPKNRVGIFSSSQNKAPIPNQGDYKNLSLGEQTDRGVLINGRPMSEVLRERRPGQAVFARMAALARVWGAEG